LLTLSLLDFSFEKFDSFVIVTILSSRSRFHQLEEMPKKNDKKGKIKSFLFDNFFKQNVAIILSLTFAIIGQAAYPTQQQPVGPPAQLPYSMYPGSNMGNPAMPVASSPYNPYVQVMPGMPPPPPSYDQAMHHPVAPTNYNTSYIPVHVRILDNHFLVI
jgi:hypothetical protein